ncbi:transglycosylase domain-containing protein [Paenibacillus abyssi]|uniref:Penicillin-binding protein n=1 Tax=Paenibacillus abyssi TaxID=1340531 RepID=A0A917LGL3_9BACL|nr:PBP1A family penicillin-binding protein [Paenibacillus abyssi]GGG21069.1 penicillin-binding protein [Paenibacillus abyssi]
MATKTAKNSKSTKKRIWQLAIFVLILTVIGLVLTAAVFIDRQDVSALDNPLPEPTIIYDMNGKPASRLTGSRIVPVSLEQVPQSMRNAIIAVEDKRFYDHEGVDASALFRALYRNTKAGDVVEGGSTITQQLAKNVFLTSERSYERKLKEAAMAIKIDNTYEKDEILEMYLNQIYFGEGSWGVGQASRTYFGKTVADLTLAESALLAALPKAPSNYSPLVDADKALERRNLVLSLMKDQGMITEEEYSQAVNEPLQVQKTVVDELSGKYTPYVNHVIEEAEKIYGLTEDEILRGGLRVYTNLNPAVQGAMEEVFADETLFPGSPDEIPVQSGAAIIDPATGGIRGLAGGRGEQVFRGFNRATQMKRQPGSAFKPLAVFAPALEAGYSPSSILYDDELDINGYQPQNYDRQTRGEVTLADAVKYSYNIPAVWLLNEIGVQQSLTYLERMAIPVTDQDRNLSIALGGLNRGVSPLELAGAYGSFANGGKRVTSHAIVKIETKDGRLIAEAKPSEVQVVSAATAYTMTRLLQEAVTDGTGKRAQLNRPTAGKTGTTQLPRTKEFEGISGTNDIWFAGYTPELAAAVWMGYDKTDSKHFMDATGGSYTAVLFKEMMSKALVDVPVSEFQIPDGYTLEMPVFVPKRENRDRDREREKELEEDRKEREKEREEREKKLEEDRKERAKERKKSEKEEKKERKEREKERKEREKKRERDDDDDDDD